MSASLNEAGQAHEKMPTLQEVESWDEDQLLEWIQRTAPRVLKEENLSRFKEAEVDGSTFLRHAGDPDFFTKLGLTYVPSDGLAFLAKQVVGEPSKQTVDQKRKEDEAVLPEPPISPKKIRREDDSLSRLAANAREQRDRVRKTIMDIDQLSDSFDPAIPFARAVDQPSDSFDPAIPFARAVDRLSDPSAIHTLAFPFVGFDQSGRFKSTKDRWSYVGRTKFKELVRVLMEVRQSSVDTYVWLYGTRGYGKSHLLAALVCYLAAQDERVIYIPDCWRLLKTPIRYIRAAMLFAWAGDTTVQEKIMALNTQSDIENFFSRNVSSQDAIFVVDQMNAFKTSNCNEEQKSYRPKIRHWLDDVISGCKAVFSSSANHTDYLEESVKENSNRVLQVYGGLTRTEMDQWWRRSGITMSDEEKKDVEDITGCIPLLLDKCMVNGKLDINAPILQDIYDSASNFAQDIYTKTEATRWRGDLYCDFVTACFLSKPVPGEWDANLDLVDHRYFYYTLQNNQRIGGYTCGLARNGVEDRLLFLRGISIGDTDLLPWLDRVIDNPSVTGFVMEHIILSAILSKGLRIGDGMAQRMELRLLEPSPEFDKTVTNGPVLYRPRRANYRAIDGIIYWAKDDKENQENDQPKKLFFFPFQITMAPASHSDSHEEFFKAYSESLAKLSEFDIELCFLWITPEYRLVREHQADQERQWPHHGEEYIALQDVKKDIWEKYEAALQKLPPAEYFKRKAAAERPASVRPATNPAQANAPQANGFQGHPPQDYPPQGYPPQANGFQGYPPQGYPPQGYVPQGCVPQGYVPQGYVPQGNVPQGYVPQGYPLQTYTPQANAPQGNVPQGYVPQANAPQGNTQFYINQRHASRLHTDQHNTAQPDVFMPTLNRGTMFWQAGRAEQR